MTNKSIKIGIFMTLVIVMIFSLTGITKATTYVAKIGTEEYTTLAEAIADVPKDKTETTITLLKNVESGTGFIVETGQNIIIDFNGFSYDTSKTVGSTGTETNGCQLLKGAKVELKNGTLKSTSAKILIQNYCDLTLKDMNICATNAQYVSSNNCGKVNIIGNTSITAKPGAFAFDMCWAPNKNYPEGTQIIVDTTGKITGNIELDLWGAFSDTNGIKSTLNIKNINHDGTFIIDEKLKNQLTIEGGTYASDISKNVATGCTCLKVSDTQYKVGLKATNLSIDESVSLLAGESKTLETTITPAKTIETITYSSDNVKVATVDASGKVTAIAEGTAKITAKVGTIEKKCTVTVKEMVIEGNKAEISVVTINNAIETAKENENVVLNLKEEGKTVTTAEVPLESLVDIKNAKKSLEVQTSNATITLDGKTLATITKSGTTGENVTLKFEEIKEEKLTDKQKEAIKNKEVAMVVSAEIKIGTTNISDFDGGKVTIKIPFTPAEGTKGSEYKILYVSDNGKVEEITTKYEDGYLIATLEHFSNYVVVKNEVKDNEKDVTPKTGITNYIIILGIVGTILLSGIIVLRKRTK